MKNKTIKLTYHPVNDAGEQDWQDDKPQQLKNKCVFNIISQSPTDKLHQTS